MISHDLPSLSKPKSPIRGPTAVAYGTPGPSAIEEREREMLTISSFILWWVHSWGAPSPSLSQSRARMSTIWSARDNGEKTAHWERQKSLLVPVRCAEWQVRTQHTRSLDVQTNSITDAGGVDESGGADPTSSNWSACLDSTYSITSLHETVGAGATSSITGSGATKVTVDATS